jgi:hypothetical protein
MNVAMLLPVTKTWFRERHGVSAEVLDEIRTANRIDPNAERNEALNVYLYEPDGTHLNEAHVVDFTRVFSVPMRDTDIVRERKILQLDDTHRSEFRLKLDTSRGRRDRQR